MNFDLRYIKIVMSFVLITSGNQLLGQSQSSSEKIRIDPSIKRSVLKNIRPTTFIGVDTSLFYDSPLMFRLYKNGKIDMSTYDTDTIKPVFSSVYWWDNDTLNIKGRFDTHIHQGFHIKVITKKFFVFYTLHTVNDHQFKLPTDSTWQNSITIPAKNYYVVLDRVVKKQDNELLYGFIEFESGDYYSNKDDLVIRRNVLKVYFKSKKTSLTQDRIASVINKR